MWSAKISFGDFPDIMQDEEKVDRLLDAMDGCGIFTYVGPLQVLTLDFNAGKSEDIPDSAILTARARGFLREIGHGDEQIIELIVNDRERPARTSEMYRYADMARLSGKSRQYMAQLAEKDPAFPTPDKFLPDGTPLFYPMTAMRYVHKKFPDDVNEKSTTRKEKN